MKDVIEKLRDTLLKEQQQLHESIMNHPYPESPEFRDKTKRYQEITEKLELINNPKQPENEN